MLLPHLINRKGKRFIKIGKKLYPVKNTHNKTDQGILRDIIKILKMIDKQKKKMIKKKKTKGYKKPILNSGFKNGPQPIISGTTGNDFIRLLEMHTTTKINDFEKILDKQQRLMGNRENKQLLLGNIQQSQLIENKKEEEKMGVVVEDMTAKIESEELKKTITKGMKELERQKQAILKADDEKLKVEEEKKKIEDDLNKERMKSGQDIQKIKEDAEKERKKGTIDDMKKAIINSRNPNIKKLLLDKFNYKPGEKGKKQREKLGNKNTIHALLDMLLEDEKKPEKYLTMLMNEIKEIVSDDTFKKMQSNISIQIEQQQNPEPEPEQPQSLPPPIPPPYKSNRQKPPIPSSSSTPPPQPPAQEDDELLTPIAEEEGLSDNEVDLQASGKMIGRGLYNYEIEALMKEFPKFLGVYALNQLDRINPTPKKNFSFIMNTKPSPQDGHWVAVMIEGDKIYYFDSFADEPSRAFLPAMKKILKKWNPNIIYQFKINLVRSQKTNADTCGYHSMKFIRDIYAGKSFKEATRFKIIEDSLRGEDQIKKFKKATKQFGYVKTT